ncbi:major facilitator superfamily domain-containing protein [Mycena olivaceomarginata]|nr:major facilitator superfamily domain-containing protein [Mycena olivaceomarginata]
MPAIQTRLDFKPELDANSADACGPAGEATLALDVLGRQSKTRKILLLGILCLALFLDTFNNSSLFTAIPVISVQLDISNSQSVWLLSAYQLTFAALLLISGRVSDLYDPKWVFCTGAVSMGVFALINGFIRNKIPLLVVRALTGAAGALTIPSAMHLIVHMYPDPSDQAKAVTAFGAMGGIGIVMGLIIGALFVSFTSWPWVFYFSASVSGVIGVSAILLIPNLRRTVAESRAQKILRLRRLDLLGVLMFTVASILFIFSITSGSIDGWSSAQVIAPLSFHSSLFFSSHSAVLTNYPSSPSKMWSYENFTVLILVSFAPFMWWGSIFLLFAWLWEVVYGWSAIKTALHFLPAGVGMFPVLPLAAGLQSKLRLKWVIVIGFLFLPFADSADKYWRFGFPGFLLGTAGASLIYTTTNIALLANPPAILTSIQTSVQISRGGPTSFSGRAAGLWFLFAFLCAMAGLVVVFMKDSVGPVKPPGKGIEVEMKVSKNEC